VNGRWEETDWRGRKVRAWLPDPLDGRTFQFREGTIRACEQATAALRESDGALPTNWEPLARLLLRTEGIASSSIEGVRAPVIDVAVAELSDASNDAGWIADNLRAVTTALSHSDPLTIETLHRWHRQLMGNSALDETMIGAFRTAPSWIGGTSPIDAAFVPPQATHVPALMSALVSYANEDHHDPVTQAGLVHAQFETIHPYGDGNGRLGRILIGWLHRRRGVITKLPPPISVLIARDPGGYISGLHLFRGGPADSWVRWFADIASAAATQSTAMVTMVSATLATWHDEVEDLRRDSAARGVIAFLPETPVVTANIVAQRLGVSTRAARAALNLLEERGILDVVDFVESVDVAKRGAGRPTTHYAATKLLGVTVNWTRPVGY